MAYAEVIPLLTKKTIDRFNKYIKKTDSCWLWTGRKFTAGYGMFEIYDLNLGKKRKTTSHRISWMIKNGTIKRNLFVCHSCDNPPCVNPTHLFVGTQSMNLQDAIAKGRFQNIARGRQLIGEKNNRTKLTIDDVTAIKVLNSRGMSSLMISQIFNVSENCIRRIVSGHSWKYHAAS